MARQSYNDWKDRTHCVACGETLIFTEYEIPSNTFSAHTGKRIVYGATRKRCPKDTFLTKLFFQDHTNSLYQHAWDESWTPADGWK